MTKAEIQLVRSLGDKRARQEVGLFVVEGEKLVGEVVASGLRVRKVYRVADDVRASAGGVSERVSASGVTERVSAGGVTEYVSAKDMARASHLKTPAGCLALVEIPRREFDSVGLKGRLTFALDGVQNPGNMGTIIRLADWFGIRNVLCSSDCADCWSPKVIQATMGAITRVAIHYGDLAEMIPAGIPVFGAFLEGDNIYKTPLPRDGVVVLGSEGRGISAGVERLVTQKLFIPPTSPEPGFGSGSVSDPVSAPESLNVAIAAAIICSEFRRR